MNKQRLDRRLVEKKQVNSRSKALQFIKAGIVYVNKIKVTKAGFMCDETDEIVIQENPLCEYVSRGGLKLKKALDFFHVDLKNKVVLDIGASTGGFTDCCLQNGAQHVFALDVGSHQLADALRCDSRVTSIENMNFKNATLSLFHLPIDLITIDVSFISLESIFFKIKELFNNIPVIALFKPQFEVGIEKINKNGVVKNQAAHIEALKQFQFFLSHIGFILNDITFSPIMGFKEGNIEYLCCINFETKIKPIDPQVVVNEAFKSLRGSQS